MSDGSRGTISILRIQTTHQHCDKGGFSKETLARTRTALTESVCSPSFGNWHYIERLKTISDWRRRRTVQYPLWLIWLMSKSLSSNKGHRATIENKLHWVKTGLKMWCKGKMHHFSSGRLHISGEETQVNFDLERVGDIYRKPTEQPTHLYLGIH